MGMTVGAISVSGSGLAVASGVGLRINGAVAEGEDDSKLGNWKPWLLRDNDQNRIAPMAPKAMKIPTNSSNPKGVFGDDCGSGGKFVICYLSFD